VKYDCQGQGEFIAMKTLPATSANKLFEIQARFNSGIKDFVGEGGITVMKGIVIDTGVQDVPVVQALTTFDEALGECVIDYFLTLNGAEVQWPAVATDRIDFQRSGVGTRSVDYVYFPDTGLMYTVSAKWGSFGCRMNSKICIPPDFINQNTIVGLLGSPDGSAGNEWMKPNGAPVPNRGEGMQSEYEYCTTNWCATKAETMFTYFDDTTYDNFSRCAAAFDPVVEEMLRNPTADCLEDCAALTNDFNLVNKEALYDNCLLECAEGGAVSAIGDIADAELLQDVQKKCGNPETEEITPKPTLSPTPKPTRSPTPKPTRSPTPKPTESPTAKPTESPTAKPTESSTPEVTFVQKQFFAPPAPTDPAPTDPVVSKRAVNGAFGDPHVRTWGGEHFEYHGACDLVLVHNPDFANGLGMDIHIRNKRVKRWSYIDAAVLRIGDETFEIKGGVNTNEFWVNGVLGNSALENGLLPETIAGYAITFDWLKGITGNRRRFAIDLGNGEQVVFKTFQYFIRVNIIAVKEENFKSSVGLMGTYPEGKKVARDMTTILEDYNQFGQEWQVLPGEPMLFHTVEGAQAPEMCEMPIMATSRRLAESSITMAEAEIACSRVDEDDRDACIFDVLATEDKDMAGAY